jgi:DNA-binding transcriptional MerR regulator
MNSELAGAPPGAMLYTLETVVQLTGVGRETLAAYCAHGLLPVAAAELETAAFDDHLLCTIRRIAFLEQRQGINLAGIRIIHELLAEVERLHRELRFAREAW